ncbi:MAG: M20 family metallopeptidase [Pseudomonadales bacterium]|nr:M20 family metallopeptidase [Pseudomonadales bacterium]
MAVSRLFEEIKQDFELIKTWRRDIHAHPELGFQEHRTAKIVADLLNEWGIEVHQAIGGTGVVGKITHGTGQKAIGLRADMDALPMQEMNDFDHKSIHDGIFHGCGHDGHTAMLLGAAKYLAKNPDFDGTVYFIFQPAEEGLGGAVAMIEDDLFERFPMQEVYGMHNFPGIPLGNFAICPGPMMAAFSTFDIRIKGIGGHAALPQHCVDPIIIAANLVQSIQSIVSRNLDPLKTGVISVTKLQGGNAYNVIPNEVTISGGIRYFDKSVGAKINQRLTEVSEGIGQAYGAEINVQIDETFTVLDNDVFATQFAIAAAKSIAGVEQVEPQMEPICGSEDFAFMLEKKPGAYIFLGNGEGEGGCMIHHPEYDFNDEAALYGVSYWVQLVKQRLAKL